MKETSMALISRFQEALYALLSLAFFLGLWELAVRYFEVPSFFVPAPSAVALAIKSGFSLYLFQLGFTLYATLIAFVLALVLGIVLAMLISEIKFLDRVLMPLLVALQSMPRIALAPLIIVWLGFGISSKVAIGAFTAFFPVFLNALHGLKTYDPEQIALMRSLKASRLQILLKIKIPNSVPFLLAGANIGIILAMLSVIVGEFVGANRGIGYLIVTQSARMDMPGVMGGIFFLSLVGIVFHYGLQALRRRLLRWEGGGSEVAGAPI
jgi:NitT/TauT family transport system permease protein